MLKANRSFYLLCETHTSANVMERFIEHFCVTVPRMYDESPSPGLNKHFYLDVIIYNMDNGRGFCQR